MKIHLFLFLCCCTAIGQITEESNKIVKKEYYLDDVISKELFFNKENILDSIKTYYKTGELDEIFYYNKGRIHGECYKLNKESDTLTYWKFKNNKLIKRKDYKLDYNNRSEESVLKKIETIKSINKSFPGYTDNLEKLYKLAQNQLYLGNRVLALHYLTRIEKDFNEISIRVDNDKKIKAGLYDLLARLHASFENIDIALTYYLKSIKISPNESRLYYNLGAYLIYLRHYHIGMQYLSKANQMVPKHSYANWALGIANLELHNYQKGLEHINIAIRLEDKLHKAMKTNTEKDLYTIRGFLNYKNGKINEGISDLEKALELDANNSLALYFLGLINYENENNKEACELFQKANSLGFIKKHDNRMITNYLEKSCTNQNYTSKKIVLGSKYFLLDIPSYLTGDKLTNNIWQKGLYTISNKTHKNIYSGTIIDNVLYIPKLEVGCYKIKDKTNSETEDSYLLIN